MIHCARMDPAMNVRTAPRMDKASFWRWFTAQERRFELFDGVPRMLPHVTRHHDRICTNIVAWLLQAIDRDRFDLSTGDFAIETGPRSIRFPDIMVHPFVADDPKGRSTVVAPLLVEVLSDSTAREDHGPKLAEYGGLAGVGCYLICAQDEARARLWSRAADGTWPAAPVLFTSLDGVVVIPSLGITLPMAEIYRRVQV
jgi:Uma2 family endonuclease